MTANEAEFARKIKGYLDDGSAGLQGGTLYRLGQARAAALDRIAGPVRSPAFALAAAGGGGGASRPFYAQVRVWVGVALIALAGFGWQQYRVHEAIEEAEEIDSKLLASDLPYDAYLDRGFQNWLKTVAQH
ncbi:MAG: DUF3619 family protein [Burkholderiales bacterium]|jgi:hypothetical protein|nr:DUF3619 family protein [Burkholderiales bacterium]